MATTVRGRARGGIRLALLWDFDLLHSPPIRRRLAGVDLLLFPELADGGYAALRRGEGRHRLEGPLLRRLRRLTAELPLTLVAGTLAVRAPGGGLSNTALVFRGGRRIARYDKIHLFAPAGDRRFFRAGSTPATFPLDTSGPPLTCGLAVCYDLRFPELFRRLAGRGARLFLVPARWPAAREDAWRTLLKARAIENQAFVVGCNAGDREGGRSYVFSPLGEELYAGRGGGRAGIATVMINRADLREARRLHDNLRDAVLLPGGRPR